MLRDLPLETQRQVSSMCKRPETLPTHSVETLSVLPYDGVSRSIVWSTRDVFVNEREGSIGIGLVDPDSVLAAVKSGTGGITVGL